MDPEQGLFNSAVGRFTVVIAIALSATAPGAAAVAAYHPSILDDDAWKALFITWAVGGTSYGICFFIAFLIAHKASKYHEMPVYDYLLEVSTGVFCIAGGLSAGTLVLAMLISVVARLCGGHVPIDIGVLIVLGLDIALLAVIIGASQETCARMVCDLEHIRAFKARLALERAAAAVKPPTADL